MSDVGNGLRRAARIRWEEKQARLAREEAERKAENLRRMRQVGGDA